MENKEENKTDVAAEQPKPAAKPKFKPAIELDMTGPYLHITIPDFHGWIQLYMNDKKYKVYKVVDGFISIQLSGPLPREYRFRAEVLKK
jgi:hypothetical protein